MMKTKHYIKEKEFDGLPTLANFKLVEEDVDENLLPGEALTEAICLSVDPFIRVHEFPVGSTVIAFQAARVLKSTIDQYPEGCIVMFPGGWKTVSKIQESDIWYRVDDIIPEKDITHAVGVLGMPGLSAYIGFLELCKPQKGETVMVNACTGAVGGMVGQIAKIKGCRVIGCCGSDEKVKLAESLGYDGVFNYKTEKSWPEAIKRLAPNGIDCFFDNVGGQLASDTIHLMNTYGRVCCCGSISAYNSTDPEKVSQIQLSIVSQQLELKGFIISDPRYRPRYPEAVKQTAQWIAEGKIKVKETISDGFAKLPTAFIDLFSGKNVGKAVVRV